jgi:hypothetical protein
MNFKKHFVSKEQGKYIYVVSDHYWLSLAAILDMAQEIRKDFPMLNDSDIEIRTYDGLLGFEFEVPRGFVEIPDSYIQCSQMPSYYFGNHNNLQIKA